MSFIIPFNTKVLKYLPSFFSFVFNFNDESMITFVIIVLLKHKLIYVIKVTAIAVHLGQYKIFNISFKFNLFF